MQWLYMEMLMFYDSFMHIIQAKLSRPVVKRWIMSGAEGKRIAQYPVGIIMYYSITLYRASQKKGYRNVIITHPIYDLNMGKF